MADTPISGLPAVVTPAGTDEFAVNQSSVSKKMTLTQIRETLPAANITGQVAVANGGTGVATLGSGNVLVGAGTSPVTSTKAAPTNDFVGNTGTPVNNQLAVWTDATTIEGDSGLTWDGTNLTTTGSIFIQEKAEAAADVAGYGQIWIDTATPNVLYFTDDAGTDQEVTTNAATQTLTNKTLGAVTLSGTVTGADQEVNAVELGDYSEDTHTDATWTGAESLSYVDGPFYILTLTGNVTLTITNPPASGSAGTMTLKLIQDATGSRTVTWPAAVDWAGGTAPTLSTGANDVDFVSLITHDAGTTWYGFLGGLDFA